MEGSMGMGIESVRHNDCLLQIRHFKNFGPQILRMSHFSFALPHECGMATL
jgi:hypothetical protein